TTPAAVARTYSNVRPALTDIDDAPGEEPAVQCSDGEHDETEHEGRRTRVAELRLAPEAVEDVQRRHLGRAERVPRAAECLTAAAHHGHEVERGHRPDRRDEEEEKRPRREDRARDVSEEHHARRAVD